MQALVQQLMMCGTNSCRHCSRGKNFSARL